MPDPAISNTVLSLVHEGWDHLKHQRPLAAWASWRRALRIEPEHKAATHALHVLANATDLPAVTRTEHKFLTPGDHRARWDARLRDGDLEDLAVAASAFGELADADPSDSHARFNQGLCLAWLGRNADSVEAFDQAIVGLMGPEPELAVLTGALTEILRQGGGAEPLADDLNHVVTMIWTPGPDPAGFLDDRADVRPIANPIDPATGLPQLSEARLYEWLDRPWFAEPTSDLASPADLRRIRATVVRRPGSLRLSGTDPILLEEAVAEVARVAVDRIDSSRREASPLPLAFLDAAVWAVRMPPGLDEEAQGRLNRSAVERYYEDVWVRRPRKGLQGRSPIEAGQLATEGDQESKIRLEAIVRLREQLGERPTTALLYQGYPFDRLRRRLGLAPTDPDALDPLDAASMSGPELDKLEPASLDDYTLADAYESAAALGLDARTARFAEVLATREPIILARLDVRALFATLVRNALAGDNLDQALGHLDRAEAVDQALTGGRDRPEYETWRAEVYVRTDHPAEAVRVYEALMEESPDAARAIDAVETLHDAGFDEEARLMAHQALTLAEASGDEALIERAEAYLVSEGI